MASMARATTKYNTLIYTHMGNWIKYVNSAVKKNNRIQRKSGR